MTNKDKFVSFKQIVDNNAKIRNKWIIHADNLIPCLKFPEKKILLKLDFKKMFSVFVFQFNADAR